MVDPKRIVTIAPEHLFDKNDGSFIKLRHPRYDDASMFFFRADDLSLWEVQQQKDKYRSWLIGNSVKSDGSLYFITPFDPLFMAIQYLKQKSRFSTLDTIMDDPEYPEVKQIVDSKPLTDRLNLIADVKSSAGFTVALFSESKTLKWLERRFHKVIEALKANDIYCHPEGASQASSWRSDEASDPEALRQYAFGLLEEWLPDDVAELLASRLDIKIQSSEDAVSNGVKPTEAKSTKQQNGVSGENEEKTKAVKTENDDENAENGCPPKKRRSIAQTTDYEEAYRKMVDVRKEAEEKKLKPKLKREAGMQSITNFFKKN